jgi:5-methylcytosine-specific restriction endonuclease McrA
MTIVLARTSHLMVRGGRCHYCREVLSCTEVTADHKIPRSKGGYHSADNIAAVCKLCNQAKGALTERQFFRCINKGKPRNLSTEIMLAFIRRRINRRAHRACERIEALVT